MVFISSVALPLAVGIFISAASAADVPLYGQCGGTGFSGSASCVSGGVCQSQNPYYYQCVEGTATATATSQVASSTAIVPMTTAIASSSKIPVSSATSKKKCSSTFATSVAASNKLSSPASVEATPVPQTSSAQDIATSVQPSLIASSAGPSSSESLLTTTFAALPTAIVSSSSFLSSPQAAVVSSSSSSIAAASPSSVASSGTKYLMVL